MAKTIKEMMQKAFWETDISDHPAKAYEQGYEACANTVLEEIEKCLNEHHFHSAFFLEDTIRNVIKELKGE